MSPGIGKRIIAESTSKRMPVPGISGIHARVDAVSRDS
jgi:hypothetical protein